MAFSVTDSGVTMTKGRGRNAVALVLSFKEIEAWAKRMKVDEARLWRNSYGRACHGLKKKFADVMKNAGGVLGVPKFKDFEDFTKELRKNKVKKDRPIGGVLADKSKVVAFKRNGYQVIGWPDYLEDAAESFQEGRGGPDAERYFTDPHYRHFMHLRGVKDVPHSYVHNERMVIVPYFVEYVRKHLDEWAKGAFYKELARQMNKQGAFK